MKKLVPVSDVISKLGTEDMVIKWICDGPTLSDIVDFLIHSKNQAIHVNADMEVLQPWGEILLALAKRDHWTHVDVEIQA